MYFFDDKGNKLARSAKAAKKMGADFVIASIHWGLEYQTKPSPKIEEIAKRPLKVEQI